MKKYLSFIFVILIFLGFANPTTGLAKDIDDLIFYTEPYPPYNFETEGEIKGISVDLLVEMLKQTGSKISRNHIKIVPWARSYKDIQLRKNISLFSMTRTVHRERMFKWVGPIAPTILGVIARKENRLKVDNIEDLKKLKIGVIREDICHQLLLNAGIPSENIQPVAKTINNIRKLNSNRIDAWAYELNVSIWEIKSFGFDPELYETIFILQKSSLWYAFNIQTSDEAILELQKAYEEIVKLGRYQKILDSYLK